MTTYPHDLIAADLQSKFDQISENDTDQMFYFKLADYGKYLLSNKDIKDILRPLRKDAKQSLKNYDKVFSEFIVLWKDYASDLLSNAKKLGYEDDHTSPFTSTMSAIEAVLDGTRPIKTTDRLGDYWIYYWFLVRRFHDDGNDHVLIPKHFDEDAKFYHLQAPYDHATAEWEMFKNDREIQTWWACYQIERLATIAYKLSQEKRIIKGTGEQDDFYIHEFRQILLGDKPQIVNRRKFEDWFRLVHNFVMPRLRIPQEKRRSSIGTAKLEYYPDSGKAYYKGSDYDFTGKARALLNLLYKSKNIPFSLAEIKAKCNEDVSIMSRKFIKDKDTRDTITYIRDQLGVGIREYFPIAKRDGRFIWTEK